MKYAIVTGASKGLGKEVAKNLLQSGYHVISVARQQQVDELEMLAQNHEPNYRHISGDLSSVDQIENIATSLSEQLTQQTIEELLIVNNAGMVTPMGPVGQLENETIAKHVTLNLTAPMILINTLKAQVNPNRLAVINITSGAAEKAIYGWNAYSSTKAAINQYTETSAVEANELGSNDLHIAFSPGVMDTDMQGEIRSATTDEFKDVDNFKQLKDNNQLRSPKEVADLLQNLINDQEQLENGRVYRVYDLIQ
ncbi:SDR family NAD(P)-dependent oxidoreductase [Alkalibacillus salilacus]|uniref:Benzil reductase ((S)-benzoin forming) n=1 Tax=Alkalibacillus salilacus TaxID=284582 RepID=A0ABT9VCS3_9BACI|nr:SDR family NAD(P)-dependent oxidoreductase [Alkalibacillus salilacus]MDQ0158744.1 benzil reductase ((S)-benzoin forming) [Alkalibacillus salilacus]